MRRRQAKSYSQKKEGQTSVRRDERRGQEDNNRRIKRSKEGQRDENKRGGGLERCSARTQKVEDLMEISGFTARGERQFKGHIRQRKKF